MCVLCEARGSNTALRCCKMLHVSCLSAAGRDVHELSTMKRACGGEGGFASQSPAVILERALAREQQGQRPAGKAADQASQGKVHMRAACVEPGPRVVGIAG